MKELKLNTGEEVTRNSRYHCPTVWALRVAQLKILYLSCSCKLSRDSCLPSVIFYVCHISRTHAELNEQIWD